MIFASVVTTIAAGLVYTLGIDSPAGHWIGYQVLAGIGLGVGFQIPIIVAQASVDLEDIPVVTAIILFFQTIGGAFMVSAGQTAFANKLVSSLASNAPHVNAAEVVATGATLIRSTFSAADVPGILLSYVDGLRVAFAIGIALGGLSLFPALFSEWRKIDAKKAMGAT